MSIQSELPRLTNAKAAIQTAIEGKGVTVPSGTLLDGMAPLIEAIQTGGRVITGTFTVESDTMSHDIDYFPQSVDEWPSWLIVIAEKEEPTAHSSFRGVWVTQVVYSNVIKRFSIFDYEYSQITYGYNRGVSKYYTPYFGSGRANAASPRCNPNDVASDFLAGVTYRYYMGIG